MTFLCVPRGSCRSRSFALCPQRDWVRTADRGPPQGALMDADRFDSLAKRLVSPTTRRATLGGLAAGGLLSALGLSRAIPETRAAQSGTCTLAFVATVRLGPNVQQVLTTNSTQPGELRGELSFVLSQSDNLEQG